MFFNREITKNRTYIMRTLSFIHVILFIHILCSSVIRPRVINTFHRRTFLNNKPIIGVLAQEFVPDINPFPVPGNSYIFASYVKFLESAGARVVPIKINQHPETILKLLSSVNGVLIPGGTSDVANSPYATNAKYVFNYAVHERYNGRFFPVWGTCLGLQQLAALVAGSNSILSPSSGTWDVSMTLPDLDKTGRMTENIPPDLFRAATVEPLTYNVHYNCVSVETYNNNEALRDFFRVLSTNVDRNGKRFLSTVEGEF